MNLNRLAAAASAFVVLQSCPLAALELRSNEIGKSARECASDPAYASGGANVGDCLLDRAAKLEPHIATALHRTSKRFCHAESRKRLWQAQNLWTDYHRAFCSLIEESPGNTPAYVNAGACTLQATQQRLEALRSVGDTVTERCLTLSFEHEASRFGRPPAIGSIKHPSSGIVWQVSRAGNKILVGKGGRLAALDATGCSYCSDKPNCSEGVFLFEYPSPTANDPAFRDYAILHACKAEGGTRLTRLSDVQDWSYRSQPCSKDHHSLALSVIGNAWRPLGRQKGPRGLRICPASPALSDRIGIVPAPAIFDEALPEIEDPHSRQRCTLPVADAGNLDKRLADGELRLRR